MSDQGPTPHPHRSAGHWLLLISVWLVGLVIWLIYAAVLVYLYLKILGA